MLAKNKQHFHAIVKFFNEVTAFYLKQKLTAFFLRATHIVVS